MTERIGPRAARRDLESDPDALLVCAYEDPEKFKQNRLEGAISLDAFAAQADGLDRGRELIFYCA